MGKSKVGVRTGKCEKESEKTDERKGVIRGKKKKTGIVKESGNKEE